MLADMDPNEQIQHSRKQHLTVIEDYVHQVLLPALDFKGDVSIIPADAGIRSLVYFLEGPEFERRILRAEPIRHRCERRIRGHKLLQQHGFHVPRVLYQDMDPAVRKQYGFYFLVESCLKGVHYSRAPDPMAAASSLGETLARMHAITSRWYGWPGELRWQGRIMAGMQLRRQARVHLRIYRQRERKFPERIKGWFKDQPLQAWFPRPRLTTAGLTSTNLLVQENRVALLDLARVCYAVAGRDLAQVRFGLAGNDENAAAVFFEAYRRQASEKHLAELAVGLPLFEALYLLRRAADVKNRGRNEVSEQALLNHCGV
jgi:Ser/Thr protein kinase RdoA (MazF antagonist)